MVVRLSALLVVLVSLGVASAAFAKPKVTLSYRVAGGCPPAAEFESALRARGASLEESRSAVPVSALEVAVGQNEGTFRGTLRVRGPGTDSGADEESSALREVHAADCGEVVKGLAIVAAIALGAQDERGTVAGGESAEPAPAGVANAAGAARSEEKPKAAADSARVEAFAPGNAPRRLRGSSFKREREIEVQAGTLHVDRVQDLTLSAGAQFALVPGIIMPRYDLTARVTHFITPPGGSSRIVGPTLEVNVNFLSPVTRDTGGYATQVFGFGAGVRSCSAITYDSEGLLLHLCSEFGLMAVQLDTKDADGKLTQKKSAGLGIAGIGADFQYNLGRYVHVGVRASGQVQVGGASAERPDGSSLFKVPLFGGYAVGGVGVHF